MVGRVVHFARHVAHAPQTRAGLRQVVRCRKVLRGDATFAHYLVGHSKAQYSIDLAHLYEQATRVLHSFEAYARRMTT